MYNKTCIGGNIVASNSLIFKDAEAVRDAIMVSQQKQIAGLYEEWADEIGERAKYFSHKSNASAAVSERYMRELQKQIRESSQQVSNEVYGLVKNNIYTVSDAMVKSNAEWFASMGISRQALNGAFSSVPDSVVRKLVTGQIYDSGWSLSKQIWGDNEQTLQDVYRVVAKGMAENRPIYDIAKELENYVRPSAKMSWNTTGKDGVKIFKKSVDYNAQRLARTLVQHGYQQSFIETTKDNPFITDYIWISNGSRVCPLCMERNGKHFKKGELPMDHPNGMCVMEPAVVDDIVDQLADWVNSSDGTYPDIDNFSKNFGYKAKKPVDMNSLEDNLANYVGGGSSSVKDAVTSEEFQFIKDNMEETSQTLYRVEDGRFTYDNIDVGETFEFVDDIRTFTRNRDGYLGKMLKEGLDEDVWEEPVVFETVGKVKHFNMDRYASNYYEDQSESLIGGKFEVISEGLKEIEGVWINVVKIKRI